MRLQTTTGYTRIVNWLANKNHHPFTFQEETWQHIINGKSGLVNAPTGCGKTFSVFLGALIDFINLHPDNWQSKANNGLQLLWITPLRALAKDIGRAMEEVVSELGMQWKIGIRNGDTDINERQRQKRRMPEVLIITPESLHLLLAQKGYPATFETLQTMAVDEWHELIGSKRGVQVELAVSRLVALRNGQLKVWGISATIGNLDQAKDVLLSPVYNTPSSQWGEAGNSLPTSREGWGEIVKANIRKDVVIESIIPDEIEKYPWAGHLGLKLIHKVLPILNNSRTTLIFINTRGMSEQWYQALLNVAPDLAGAIALHHGSIEQELRIWVEEALHAGRLKAVVATASLDLGVDFRPVETVIQVGSPKGVARFLQRAGRSGHSPGEVSKIYFLPTHSLELVEAAALKNAVEETFIESKEPMMLCFDVLIQYLSTLAISDGFLPEPLLKEIRSTYCYREMTDNEWMAILEFITSGGNALQQYDEYKKVEVIDGVFRINNRRIAMRHRMHIGTIVSESMMKVKFVSGGFIGVIEEWFITRLSPGDVFTLAGRNLELVTIKDMTALVRKSNAKKSIVPSWQGGRMPLSANLGKKLREKFEEARDIQEGNGRKAEGRGQKAETSSRSTLLRQPADSAGEAKGKGKSTGSRELRNLEAQSPLTTHYSPDIELQVLEPLFRLQETLSHVPGANELLIEHIETKDGYHLFVYPFEGRLVHEAMAAILAWRISKITPITFSFAMNDYGFELLSDQPIPVDDTNVYELFTPQNLLADIQRSANATEMAKRKFRDIAVIGGLIFQGYPGEQKKARHLQSSASLLFNVFSEYEPGNLLLRQSYQEVFDQQMEEVRLRNMLERIQQSTIIITFPQQLTPFCFPIKVDSMRENLTSEKLEDRVKRMQAQLNGS
ncbi:DNA ligase-associated DEXH box helicase [Niastella yeongjuensis]|uniref:DNA ligase-associated DEXH box helicase n=1 Tax=Niastella yeongjuensis TaxID=354355 RepID=A0A1V9EZ36_9BACT|nr:ligase-associated DNA damage response DEXH box helicase [Niastella yeongjuensis]OQP51309.1 DNA ligase-associated DEXH box helicase [Niastella yeongjuensis]SEP39030.1 ATP-dependent helicase Lhr and Lhr-like helicase [Niastella yeongjuensis]